jgi:tRNA U34 5-carboxymethylaminomethyl modifying GTPase MnmE/TrmE
MYPEEEKLHNLELKVGLLGKDVEQISELNDKLSESIEKIREMNANMIRMITIHEQRHENHEKIEGDLREDIKELHSRITTVNREIHDRIDQVERTITQRLDDIRSDLIQHRNEDEPKMGKLLKEIDQYKWMILGAAISLGWIIGNVNLGVLGTLFK